MFDPTLHRPEYADAQAAATSVPAQPTLYLHGTEDGALGIEAAGDVSTALSAGSSFVVMEGAGHFLHLQQPDSVRDHVISFLAG
jgi:pimeloyl-ACP methyl ester carboxylesterase